MVRFLQRTRENKDLFLLSLLDTFVQMDASGRLPFSTLPDLLKRFGIILTINDLISAGQELQYNGRMQFFP